MAAAKTARFLMLNIFSTACSSAKSDEDGQEKSTWEFEDIKRNFQAKRR
jgi:hypothetical protein